MDSAASSCQPARHSYLSCSWLVMTARKSIAPKDTAKMIFLRTGRGRFQAGVRKRSANAHGAPEPLPIEEQVWP